MEEKGLRKRRRLIVGKPLGLALTIWYLGRELVSKVVYLAAGGLGRETMVFVTDIQVRCRCPRI